jgi:hypothetical protein
MMTQMQNPQGANELLKDCPEKKLRATNAKPRYFNSNCQTITDRITQFGLQPLFGMKKGNTHTMVFP